MGRISGAPVIAVIGGGFSGAAFALHLVRRHHLRARLVVFEPREHLGAGLAYGASDPAHRINVPAARMSLYPDDPQSFQRFVEAHQGQLGDTALIAGDGQVYPQRSVFGAYVRAELQPYLESSAISHKQARVQEVVRNARGWLISDDQGSVFAADIVVIATTHPAPQVPAVLRAVQDHPRLIADATQNDALTGIGEDETVLIVGNGLSSADVVATLHLRGHKGRIIAISRRGLRSEGHATSLQEPFGDFTSQPARRASELLHKIRLTLRQAKEQGLSWHAVIDAVRAQGPTIWQALSIAERRRIVRFARPFWDAHRFRIAPQVEQVVEDTISERRLEVLAASLLAVQPKEQGFKVQLVPRGATPLALEFDRIILTTGPAHDGILKSQPYLQGLHANGQLSNCPTGLGIACDTFSRAIGVDGRANAALFIAGPLARGTFGELMGLPQVTEHAVFVADEVATVLARGRAADQNISTLEGPAVAEASPISRRKRANS